MACHQSTAIIDSLCSNSIDLFNGKGCPAGLVSGDHFEHELFNQFARIAKALSSGNLPEWWRAGLPVEKSGDH